MVREMLDDVGPIIITRLWQACVQGGLEIGWRCGGKGHSFK